MMENQQAENGNTDWNALFAQAVELLNQGKCADALPIYELLIKQFPEHAGLWVYYGSAVLRAGRLEDSLAAYDHSLSIDDRQFNVYSNRAVALKELKRYAESVASCDKAILLKPDYIQAYVNKGNALQAMASCREALQNYDQAIAIQAQSADAWLGRAVALHELKRFEESLNCYAQLLTQFPGFPEAHTNRGNLLQDLKRFSEAVADYDQAIAINPKDAISYANRANALAELMRLNEAVSSYDQAIALKPDYVDAYTNKAQLLLLMGDYEQGWPLYEWRFKNSNLKTLYREYQVSPYQSQDLRGKTILIHSEQGLGDTIQYCRYGKLLADQGAKVILETLAPLVLLMKTLDARIKVIEMGRETAEFDYQCPLLSLPMQLHCNLKNIPAWPAYLKTDAQKSQIWRQRLGPKKSFRIGLAWSGASAHKNDRNRSIALAQFAGILALPLEFHCLQQEIRAYDMPVLAQQNNLHEHCQFLNDFTDTAALIEQMDLVISVDTSIAHLAGALGKQTWVLLSYFPDYRWLLERSDSPWYPSVSLFRQDASRDWRKVITEAGRSLESYTN